MPTIEGMQFTGFAALDAADLPRLSYAGRVDWLKYRFETFFLTPFKRFVALENECYVWLCVVNLLCTAVEALADFEFDGTGMQRFSEFVEKYFSPDYRNAGLRLDDPKPTRNSVAVTPAQHLYKYFRCGLAHSFCIEWGGLRHREEGVPSYLFEREPIPMQKSLGIVPRELVTDFLAAVENFFEQAASWKPGTPPAMNFSRHFEEVFLVCTSPTP